jgi:hypothetical protein
MTSLLQIWESYFAVKHLACVQSYMENKPHLKKFFSTGLKFIDPDVEPLPWYKLRHLIDVPVPYAIEKV